MPLSAYITDAAELATLVPQSFVQSEEIDHEEPRKFYGVFGRDYEPEYTRFADKLRSEAISTGAPIPTQLMIASAYGRETMREERELDAAEEEAAKRDREEAKSRIAFDCAEFTGTIPSHLAFAKLHTLVATLRCASRPSLGAAELAADLHLAVKEALKDQPLLRAFYQLWASGEADSIAPRVLAKSDLWYRVQSLVGAEIIRRGLLNWLFQTHTAHEEERSCLISNRYGKSSRSYARV